MSSINVSHQQIALLFQNHREDIIHYLMQRVSCPDTAQDLSQETYLRLLRKDSLAHSDNLLGYLYRTAERLAIDFLRYDQRVSSKAELLDDSLECPNIQPESLMILRQQCELLLNCIENMPQLTQQVFLLRKIDEQSYADIAEQLGIAEKTVQRHLIKAMLYCYQSLG